MSEKIFEAIDKASEQGLDAMLLAVANAAKDEKDYSTQAAAWEILFTHSLGFLDKDAEKLPGYEDRQKMLEERIKTLNLAAAEDYKTDGNLKKAAGHYVDAGEHAKAIELYLQEGSKDSVDMAMFLMINYRVDIERAIKLRIEKEDISGAFYNLNELKYKIPDEEHQKYGEIVVRAVYAKMVTEAKQQIADRKGPKVPDTNSLTELLEKHKDIIYLTDECGDREFSNTRAIVAKTKDREVLKIGLEIANYQAQQRHSSDKIFAQDGIMTIRGKLGEVDTAIEYFVGRINNSRDALSKEYLARQAIDVYSFANRHTEALAFAEQHAPKDMRTRFKILEKIGDKEKIMAAWREAGNPVKYALAKAGKDTSFY